MRLVSVIMAPQLLERFDSSKVKTINEPISKEVLSIMKPIANLALPCCLIGGLLLAQSLQAGIVFTIENPGVQATTVPGAVTETFNSLTPGPLTSYISPGIGTFAGGQIVAANQFGGAGGTGNYYAVGSESHSTLGTLTLNSPQDYVGLWWSAGDRENVLQFFDGASLVGTFDVGDIIGSGLSSSYFGNPNNRSQDSREPFVYLDFTTTGGTQITSMDFENGLGTGFELDNVSVFGSPITPPGHAIPDAANTGLLFLIAAGALFGYRQTRRLAVENRAN
jgi:hypothetical protein